MKEGFTPTFRHQAPPKKTPPCHQPHRPIFFIEPKPQPQQEKEGKEGRFNRYTG